MGLEVASPPVRGAEFVPGATGMEALIGSDLVSVTGATTQAPWGEVEQVGVVGLQDAVSATVSFSREIKAAEARVEQAESLVGQARGNLGPSLSYRRAMGRETSSPASVTDPVTGNAKVRDIHSRTDESLTLRQPLFDLGSYGEWQRRKNLLDARKMTLAGTRGDEYLAVVQVVASLGAARIGAELARQYEMQLTELLAYVSQRAIAGAATDADMQRVKARALTARAARVEQEALQESALVEYSRLTNTVPKELRLPRFRDLNVSAPPTVAEALELAKTANPELASLRAEFEAADWDKVVGKARYGPRVDFELSDNKVTNAGGPVGLQHDQRAMVVFSWNLLSGGTDYHFNRERVARQEEVRWRVDDQQRKLIQGLSAHYAQLDSSRARLAAGYKELSALTEASTAMSQRMLAGNTSLLDLLDVVERLYQVRVRLVNLHAQELTAGSQIGRILGQPSVPALPAETDAHARPAEKGET